MGLAVLDGQLYPVWAGNFNAAYLNNGAVTAYPLNIWYRPMVIAAGPRIISNSMGPIPLAEAASGSVSISVTFDRPVNPATFAPGDVQVFFHDTTNGDPSVPLTVTGVTPVAGSGSSSFGYTQFTVTFNPLPTGANPATYNYTGTYSYLIAPDNGSGLAISSPIESYSGPLVSGMATLRTYDPDDQNADGTPDENAVTTSFIGTTPGDVYAVPTPQPTTAIRFFGAASILSPPFNQNTLPLIVPGPQVLATSVPGGDSANGNLITDGTTSTLSVTFDRPMKVSTFTPAQIVQIMGPTGPVSGPWTVTPVSPVGGLATTFTIGFPLQQLSGTYTIQLGPTIEDTFGDQLDTNQNAGLAVLRDQGQNSPTTTVHYTAGDLPKAIPAPTGTTPGQVTSTIAVPDSFIIEGDKTAAGASVMQVQISLTYPTDADLTATLTHYGQGNVNVLPFKSPISHFFLAFLFYIIRTL